LENKKCLFQKGNGKILGINSLKQLELVPAARGAWKKRETSWSLLLDTYVQRIIIVYYHLHQYLTANGGEELRSTQNLVQKPQPPDLKMA